MSTNFDITIAGAGPAGLACALSLAGEGRRVALIDPAPEAVLRAPSFDGREIALTHHACDWLKRYGAWDCLPSSAISPLRQARIESGQNAPRQKDGALLFTAPETGPDALGYLVPNHLIRTALFEVACQDSRITLIAGQGVAASSGNRDRATTLLDDGRTLSSELLIAADGRFSKIRQARGIGAIVHDFGKHILVCRVRHSRPHDGVALQWFDEGQTIAFLPVADDGQEGHLSSLVLTLNAEDIEILKQMDTAAFEQDITRRSQARLGPLHLESARCSYPLKTVYAHRFETTRLALIGDAAVGMHPITAHGFNLGLKGQEILCQEIARGNGDAGSANALSRFERTHRRATAPLFAATNGIATLYTHDTQAALKLRSFGLGLADRLLPLKTMVTGFLMDRNRAH